MSIHHDIVVQSARVVQSCMLCYSTLSVLIQSLESQLASVVSRKHRTRTSGTAGNALPHAEDRPAYRTLPAIDSNKDRWV